MAARGVDLNDDNQAEFLQTASKVVKQQGYLMQSAIDRKILKEALKHASVMLCELRTGLLTPKNYYELYMEVCDQLRHLEMFFADQHREGKKLTDLYQLVQHAGNVLPRLYLLVTIGGVYIKAEKGAACEILKDLVEMCKGVQHPLRGLFLRNYLSQTSKDKLPDVGTEYATEGGTDVAVDFVLQNFGEMNRLWVRMQHQGRGRTARPRREAERQDLRILVGTNLVRLSQMEGVTLDVYQSRVLPGVLEQVVGCKDRIAQAYLLDCLVQVFPDEFHLATLEAFLEACLGAHEAVDVRQPIMSLMDRLAAHAESKTPPSLPAAVPAFKLFSEYAGRIVETWKSTMETKQILELEVALLRFALRCYPDNLENVNSVLDFSAQLLGTVTSGKADSGCVSAVTSLLTVPLETLGLGVFRLTAFPGLLGFLAWTQRRGVARALVKRVLAGNGAGLDDADTLTALLTFISPLVTDEDDAPAEEDVDKDEFAEEQHLVAALVPLIHHDDDATLYALLTAAAKVFHGSSARRVQYTMPPVIFAVLGLVRRVHGRVAAGAEAGVPERTLFRFVHKATTSLAATNDQLGLRLFLQAAHVADGMRNNDVAYEFITQAFLVHEESADNRVEQQNILILVGALRAIRNLDANRYFDLARRTTQYAAKLFRKPEQCRMILRAAHLFWREGADAEAAAAADTGAGAAGDDSDDEDKGPVQTAAGFQKASRVGKCLKQAAAIIEKHFEPNNVHLFVEILNGYIYFFDRCEPQIPASSINMLVQLVSTGLAGLEDEEAKATATKYYNNTLALLRAKKADPQSQDRYREVEV